MRLRRIKNARQKLEEFSQIVEFNPRDNLGKWNLIFKNDNPIHLEIGMGKGKFIRRLARLNPDINYIGCELAESIVLKAARSISDEGLCNLKIINFDAANLREVFKKNEVSKLYLNFSDPWPKARHEKRRLTSAEFLKIYEGFLKDPVVIEFKTDNRKLFEFSVKEFNKLNYKFNKLSFDLHSSDNENLDEIVTTEYEEKFKSLGNVIYYIEVEK